MCPDLQSINFTQIASETDDALRSLGDRWFPRLEEFDRESQESVFRSELLKMSFAYQRLVALSAGLKYAKADELEESAFLERVSSSRVLDTCLSELTLLCLGSAWKLRVVS